MGRCIPSQRRLLRCRCVVSEDCCLVSCFGSRGCVYIAQLAETPTCGTRCEIGTYMMHTQSNMYDATSFMDGTPMPRTFLMVTSESFGDSKGESRCERWRA
jgi:hypothetical protein